MAISKNAVAVMLIIAFICLYASCKTAIVPLGVVGTAIVCFCALVIAITPKGK